MNNTIQIRATNHLFTHTIKDKHYLLYIDGHNIKKFYPICNETKCYLDAIIYKKKFEIDIVKEKINQHFLLFLALNDFIEINDVCFSSNLPEDIYSYTSIEGKKYNSLLYKNNSPFSLKLEITTMCNFNCKFCYMKGAKNEFIPSKKWINILNKLKDFGIVRIEITGGEPFLYKGLNHLLSSLDDLGFDTTICTNGSLIDDDFVRLYKNFRSADLRISYHSIHEKVFDSFVQKKGAYNRVMKSIDKLMNEDCAFSLHIVTTSHNEKSIEKTIDYLTQKKIHFEISTFIFPKLFLNKNNIEFYPSIDFIDFLVKNNYLRNSYGICSALKTKLWISCNGDIYPCEMYRNKKMGNIIKDDLLEKWVSKKFEDFRYGIDDILKKCINCSFSECKNCPALCFRERIGVQPLS